jgi:hypothetical protein
MAIKFFFKNRSFWLAFGLAVIFVLVSYLNNTVPRWLSSLRILGLILDAIQVPAVIVGIMVSDFQNHRGVENPNAIASYVTLFVTYLVIFGGVIKLVGFVNNRMLKNTKT